MITPLDEIIEYKHEIMKKLKNSQPLIALLSNNKDVDMDSDEAYDIMENNFYDYSYSDDTYQDDKASIFVEVMMERRPSVEFKGLKVNVQVLCNRKYVHLDAKKFPGMIGNRRDNIACVISDVLEKSDSFGIGDLLLTSAQPITPPIGFSSYGLVFTAVDFAEKEDDY